MRRRQIVQAKKPAVSHSGDASLDQAMAYVAMKRKPADHEACPLCGRKKTGRPKK